MNIVVFAHSIASCWNHGNAHFLRGLVRELQVRGHDAAVFEPADGWSRRNLLQDRGETALKDFARAFPDIRPRLYGERPDLAAMTRDADVVLVHEWTETAVVKGLGKIRRNGAGFRLLFHDTHHRAVSDPDSLPFAALEDYDAVLAFGESLADIYRMRGWGRRVFAWHEAADTSHFFPRQPERGRDGLVWIGNWGDDERTAALETFLFGPARRLGLPLTVYGVRYPEAALAHLAGIGARYRGWIANADVPEAFSQAVATVHVPRQIYLQALPGIPTIRVFEALACGIPLVSADWPDSEGLFSPGHDFLVARDGEEARLHLRALTHEPDMARELAANGLEAIRSRHTCAHRVDELFDILAAVDGETTRTQVRLEEAAP